MNSNVTCKAAQSLQKLWFFTLVGSSEDVRHARLLIESIRTFASSLSTCPILVLISSPDIATDEIERIDGVLCRTLRVSNEMPRYWFTKKVLACAQAEGIAAEEEIRSLVWLSTHCLVVNQPDLFDLSPSYDAACRPVHITNVGLPVDEPLDEFWSPIFESIGLEDTELRVESFIDRQKLRPYFNTHLFVVNPSRSIFRTWRESFMAMMTDHDFQTGPCRDTRHKIFLHQAILSALVVKRLAWNRIRVLPPEYSYPLHLHQDTPLKHRWETINTLVCPVYEEEFRYPTTLNGIGVHDPLRSWLMSRSPGQ
jgi:hypothetical protein